MPVSPTARQNIPAPTRVTPPANTAPPVNGTNGDALRWLNTLGRLPKNFDGAVLVRSLEGENPKLRQQLTNQL